MKKFYYIKAKREFRDMLQSKYTIQPKEALNFIEEIEKKILAVNMNLLLNLGINQ